MSKMHMTPSYRMLDLVMTDRRDPISGAPESAIDAEEKGEVGGKRGRGRTQRQGLASLGCREGSSARGTGGGRGGGKGQGGVGARACKNRNERGLFIFFSLPRPASLCAAPLSVRMERGDTGATPVRAPPSPRPASPRGPTLVASLSIREGDEGVEDKKASPPPPSSRPRGRSRSGGAVTAVALLEAAAAARPPPPPPDEEQELVVLKDLDTGKELRVEKVRKKKKGKQSARRAHSHAPRRATLSSTPSSLPHPHTLPSHTRASATPSGT